MSELREKATQLLEQELQSTGAPDPRERFREMLRRLREKDPDAFKAATRHFEEIVIPAIAGGSGNPLAEWLDFGRLLASRLAEGETVQIDATGRSAPYARPVALDRMILHLPKSPREPAIAVALPPSPSPAQRATYALLVQEAVRLP